MYRHLSIVASMPGRRGAEVMVEQGTPGPHRVAVGGRPRPHGWSARGGRLVAMPPHVKTLKAREFLFYTEDLALAGLPADFPRGERRVMWTVLQFHYGNPNAHFELQPQVARGQVELGLHFEDRVEMNDVWALGLAERASELRAALGDAWELEEWTVSWRRLHRVFHFDALTAELGREVAAEFTKLLAALQPYAAACIDEAAPAPKVHSKEAGSGGGHWRRKRAARH